MAKLTKKAEILDTLNKLMLKEADLAQTNVSGEPCKDTKVTSVSETTETTDKNAVGPEKLNDEQGYKQKPTDDKSEPLSSPKQASDSTADQINKLATEILSAIDGKLSNKEAKEAQKGITGKPCADTKVTSVSDATETTDKNDVGPEKLNKEQGYEQKPTADKSEPLKSPKKAEEDAGLAAKVASYELGRQFCELLLNKTANVKQASEKQAEADLIKEAGRRDFDTLIAQAAAELEQQQTAAAEQEKQAELQGAAAFDELYKQAQLEAVVEENKALYAKLAEYQEFEKQAMHKQAELDEAAKFEKMANLVFEKIKNELKSTPETAAAGK